VFFNSTKCLCVDRSERKWCVGGPIYGLHKDQVYFLDPAEQTENENIINSVIDRQFPLVMGPRASGKSTRLFRLRELLEQMDYYCF
jgi:hypothetical protein